MLKLAHMIGVFAANFNLGLASQHDLFYIPLPLDLLYVPRLARKPLAENDPAHSLGHSLLEQEPLGEGGRL